MYQNLLNYICLCVEVVLLITVSKSKLKISRLFQKLIILAMDP